MNLVYPTLPTHVYHDELLDALRSLGFDPNEIKSLHIERRAIEVTAHLRGDKKRVLPAGDEAATVTVRLPITDRIFVAADDKDTILDDKPADVA